MSRMNKFEYSRHTTDDTPDERSEANRETASLAGLAIALLLVVVGLLVVHQLQAGAVLQDCLLSGQHKCAPISRN
jgi:hypothetical protein